MNSLLMMYNGGAATDGGRPVSSRVIVNAEVRGVIVNAEVRGVIVNAAVRGRGSCLRMTTGYVRGRNGHCRAGQGRSGYAER
jgi:hypothetical protein